MFDKCQDRLTAGIAFDGLHYYPDKKKSPELMWVEIVPQELDLEMKIVLRVKGALKWGKKEWHRILCVNGQETQYTCISP